jgi:hypothetical protein
VYFELQEEKNYNNFVDANGQVAEQNMYLTLNNFFKT